MSKPIRIDREAEEELWAAASWYQQQRPPLGDELLQAVHDAMDRIQESPPVAPLAKGIPEKLAVRKRLVRRFPYAVYYTDLTDEIRSYRPRS